MTSLRQISSLEYPQQVFWTFGYIIKNLNTYFPNPIATVTKKNMLQLKDIQLILSTKLNFYFVKKDYQNRTLSC